MAGGAPDTTDVRIAGLVTRRRRLLGLSQSDLATRVGVSFQQVQKYETGANRISASRLFRIAEVLGVGVSDLFPLPHWIVAADTSRDQLAECERILLTIQPALAGALQVARGKSPDLFSAGADQ